MIGLLDFPKGAGAYAYMPEIDLDLVETDPVHYISTSSKYNFLVLNFYTVVLPIMVTEAHQAPGLNLKSLWRRVVDEAEVLRREGNLKYFEISHDLAAEKFERWT